MASPIQQDPSSNPYGLGDGVKYYMLEVEDWTQPSHNKRRLSSRKFSGGVDIIDSPKEQNTHRSPSPGKLSPSALPPGPPEPEVEDTFLVTHHPPNSHLFPVVRGRANSSPAARPSSLSRLLAQASTSAPEGVNINVAVTENTSPPNPVPEIRSSFSVSESPASINLPEEPQPPPSSSFDGSTALQSVTVHNTQTPSLPSPLRPGSRASRLSITSRFSGGRNPALLGSVAAPQPKAAATTALAFEDKPVSVPSSATSTSDNNNPFGSPVTPSPDESISEAMSNILSSSVNQHRRRTSSYQAPRPSPLASSSVVNAPIISSSRPTMAATATLANLASSWGMSFGRRRKVEMGDLTPTVESPVDPVSPSTERAQDDGGPVSSNNNSARDILKRF